MYLETPAGSVSVEAPRVNASLLLQGWGDRAASILMNNSFPSLIQESPTWAALPRWLLTISKKSWTSTRRGKTIWVSLCPRPATICALCRGPKAHSQEFQHLGYISLHFIFFFWVALYTAWGILVSWPGIKPTPPAVEAQSLNHLTAREVLGCISIETPGCVVLYAVSQGSHWRVCSQTTNLEFVVSTLGSSLTGCGSFLYL